MTPSFWAPRALSAAWLVGAVFVILFATLPPQPGTTSAAFLPSLLPHNLRWRDVVQNLLLYCPLGAVLGARGTTLRRAVGASAGLSLATELLQYAIPGRDPTARDVFANSLGALVAYSAMRSTRVGPRIVAALIASERWVLQARNPDSSRASLLLLRWALTIGVVLAATAVLLRPAPLPTGGLAMATPVLDRSDGPLRIGSSGAPAGFFNGTIDEVRIYESVRTAEQIAEDMLKGGSPTARAEPGLVAVYGFNANTGNNALDETGHGHDGVVSAAGWTPEGRLGGALTFDGATSKVVVPGARTLDFGEALTLEAWVLASGKPTNEATVIGRSDDAYYLRATSNQGPFRAAGGGRFGAMPRSAHLARPFRAGEWTHLAMTYDGRLIRLFVNGMLASTRVHWSPHRTERVSLNGMELTPGLVPDAAAVRNVLTSTVTLETTLICGALEDRPAPAFLIAGLQSSEALSLVASGSDLFIKPLAWPGRLGLASPATRVSGVLNRCEPSGRLPLTITGPLQNPSVMHGHDALRVTTPGLGSGWAFAIHADLLPDWVEVMATAVWLALLAMPIGMWARWTFIGAVGLALVVMTLLYIPNLFHVRSLYAHEVTALMIGSILGIVARATSRRAMRPPDDVACSGTA